MSRTRIVRADWGIAAGAAGYIAAALTLDWYRAGGGDVLGIPVPEFRLDGLRGPTLIATLLAGGGLVWLVLRLLLAGPTRIPAGAVDLGLALGAALLTAAGAVLPPSAPAGPATAVGGLWAGLGIASLWSAAAWWRLATPPEGRRSAGFEPIARP